MEGSRTSRSVLCEGTVGHHHLTLHPSLPPHLPSVTLGPWSQLRDQKQQQPPQVQEALSIDGAGSEVLGYEEIGKCF